MTRRAQLQALEPILIIIVLAIIGAAALAFFMRFSASEISADRRAFDTAEDLAMVKRLSALPELSCPRDVSTGTYCIDLEKAEAFSDLMRRRETPLLYRPALGDSLIELSWFDLSTGLPGNLTLYDLSVANATETRGARTYGTVYDPLSRSRHFATVTIRRTS